MRTIKLFLFFISFTLFLCCNPEKPESCTPIDDPTATSDIQVTFPSAGDTLKIGQITSIQLKFKQNSVMNDHIGGMARLYLTKRDFEITTPKEHTIPATGTFTCGEIPWTVGKEGLSITSDSVITATIKVWHYGYESFYNFTTQPFYIKK
jgi:hypothetical protein